MWPAVCCDTAEFTYSRPWRFEFANCIYRTIHPSVSSEDRECNAAKHSSMAAQQRAFMAETKKIQKKQQKFPTVITTAATNRDIAR